jgi:hypothetical protein
MGTGALSLRVKLPGREADHSPPSSAEVKELSGAILPLPHYAFTFTFTLLKLSDGDDGGCKWASLIMV